MCLTIKYIEIYLDVRLECNNWVFKLHYSCKSLTMDQGSSREENEWFMSLEMGVGISEVLWLNISPKFFERISLRSSLHKYHRSSLKVVSANSDAEVETTGVSLERVMEGCEVLVLTVSAQVEILVASNAADSCLPPPMLMVPGHASVHRCSSWKPAALPVQVSNNFAHLRTMMFKYVWKAGLQNTVL